MHTRGQEYWGAILEFCLPHIGRYENAWWFKAFIMQCVFKKVYIG